MKTLRCAIYTRKSTEEGLDQAFNSLHAQREACEAYVLSQAGEGWMALPEIYDDGGFSGGNMDRPALKRLLDEIRAKRVDVVVVYKVDRLTRALNDFARIVEQFDASGVSFVSVTQAFNTTSSMGRLTLNVLLSFAQFEREVTGERIRDKIMASKKKGMWMGGALPLGYDPPTDPTTRALVINETEALLVRAIFANYLELKSVHRLVAWLGEQGATTKVTVSKRGTSRGGVPFNRGNLFHLLKNRTYLGEIPHKAISYPGVHPPILDTETFDAVQTLLAGGAKVHRRRRATGSGSSPLKGIIFDADGDRMSPVTNSNGTGRSYRYYVSTSVQRGLLVTADDDLIRRVGAPALEGLITERVGRLCPGVDLFPNGLVSRVDVMPTSLVVSLHLDRLPRYHADPEGALDRLTRKLRSDERIVEHDDQTARLVMTLRPQLHGGRTEFVPASGRPFTSKVRHDVRLIRALRTAHARLAAFQKDPAAALPIATEYDRRLLRLAFLAPDIQRAILDGRQPLGLTLQALRAMDVPSAWGDQRALLMG